MRFGLPIVGKDLWANRETVQDGVHGFLVKPSDKIPYLLPGEVPGWGGDDSDFLPFMKARDERVIKDLVKASSKLVESDILRKGMGAAGRKEVEEGRASIMKRNEALRRIYEEAAAPR
jgi:glycosyltransferase involved in cell wall biosynthesis